MGAVRKYRVKFSVHEGDGARYSTQVREFGSLRAAAEFAQDLPSPGDFLGIQAVDYVELTEQERHAFALFADGKVVL
jgi:hypothetical protein